MAWLELQLDSVREPAECLIRVDGEEVTELYPFLTGVTVQLSRNEAATATLVFESRRDETGEWLVQDAGILRTWKPVIIEAAFGDYSEEVMRGYIREIRAEYPSEGVATVTVECQDDSIALDRLHRRRVWGAEVPTCDVHMMTEILGRYALSAHTGCGTGLSDIVVNQDDTDITFLKKRAAINGYELVFALGVVYFGPWRIDTEPQATIMVNAGRQTNCIHFSSSADGHQPDSVAFDVADSEREGVLQESITSDLPLMGSESADSISSGLEDFSWRMSREGGVDQETLRAAARKKANELAMKIKAEGELDGSLYGHVLRVAEPVGVDGVGNWLGGIYYVDAVTHTFNYDGYKQQFKLLRNAYGDNLDAGIGSVLAAII